MSQSPEEPWFKSCQNKYITAVYDSLILEELRVEHSSGISQKYRHNQMSITRTAGQFNESIHILSPIELLKFSHVNFFILRREQSANLASSNIRSE